VAGLAVAGLAVIVPGVLVLVVVVVPGVLVLATCHAHELAIPVRGRATNGRGDTPGHLFGTMGLCVSAPARGRLRGQNGAAMRLSARNKINATVTAINRGEATANVVLDADGIRLVASITVEAVRELGLAEGSQVVAIIKASDVIVGVPD
jgi:molybdopterin-binding protein